MAGHDFQEVGEAVSPRWPDRISRLRSVGGVAARPDVEFSTIVASGVGDSGNVEVGSSADGLDSNIGEHGIVTSLGSTRGGRDNSINDDVACLRAVNPGVDNNLFHHGLCHREDKGRDQQSGVQEFDHHRDKRRESISSVLLNESLYAGVCVNGK